MATPTIASTTASATLTATPTTTASDDDSALYDNRNPFLTPDREDIISEVLKGRQRLISYGSVLGAFLLVVIILHWTRKLSAAYFNKKSKQRNPAQTTKQSVLRKTGLPEEVTIEEEEDDNEGDLESSTTTPLLAPLLAPLLVTTHTSSTTTLTPVRRVYLWIEGLLMHQPNGSWLEDYGTMIVIFLYYVSCLWFLFYWYSYPIVLAFSLGQLCVANVPLMYILGAKHTPFSWMTGWSYEQLNVFHRHVGRVCVLTFIAHTIIFLYYFRPSYLFTHQWSLMGILAGLSFFVIGVSSVRYLRQLFYELFYVLHFIGMLLALPTIYMHYPTARPFAVVAGLSVVYDRVLRIIYDYRLVYSAVEVHPGDTVILRIPKTSNLDDDSSSSRHGKCCFWPPLNPVSYYLSHRRPLTWNTGQHVFVTVVGCGIFESHPFTIASSSATSDTMDIIIRARDGFTKRLLAQAIEDSRPRWVIIHGPYGVHPAGMPGITEKLSESDPPTPATPLSKNKIVLIAGGAGVAFTYPLYEEYRLSLDRQEEQHGLTSLHPSSSRIQKLLQEYQESYSDLSDGTLSGGSPSSSTPTRNATAPATPTAGTTTGRRSNAVATSEESGLEIEFLWVIPYRNFVNWIPGFEEHLADLAAHKIPGPVNARIWVTREDGRPDIDYEVKSMVGGGSTDREVWVATCGPDYLVRQVRNTVAELRRSGRGDVNYYAEKFGW